MPVLKNRAYVSTATTGTGTITLGSPVSGYQSFADAGVTNGNSVRYTIEDGANFEVGTGTYTASGTTLSRTPSESSNSGSAINLSGSARVFITAAGQDIQQPPSEGPFVDGDKTKLDGIEANADVTDAGNVNPLVDTHINVGSASSGQYLNWNGSDYAWGSIDTSTLMPKTGGTFTGDVTFDGATAGRDILFDRSENKLNFAHDTKLTIGNNDELEIQKYTTGGVSLAATGYMALTSDSDIDFKVSNQDRITLRTSSFGGQVELYNAGSKKFETSSSGVNVIGNIAVSGTVDGRDVATDGTKLDGIAAGANVGIATTGGTFTGDVIYQGSNANIEFDVSNDAMEVKDNARIIVGNGDDMMIYHNGTNYIDLYGNTYIRNTKADSYTFLEADNGSGNPTQYVTLNGVTGEVQLSHYGSQKLATKSTGIQTTGTINVNGAYTLPTADGAAGTALVTNGSGALSFSSVGADLYAANPSSATDPTASGANAVAIGSGAVAATNESIALGLNATVGTSTRGTALGFSANATGSQATAISDSVASGGNSFAAVADATASGTDSIALGRAATASSTYATAIGKNSSDQGSVATSGTAAMALGGSYASGTDSFAAAIANNTSSYGATGANSIAIGYLAKVTTNKGIAIGKNAICSAGDIATAVGPNATASGWYSTVIGGLSCSATQNYASALGGQGSQATGTSSTVAGGFSNTASGSYSTVTGGRGNTASYDYTRAGGYEAHSGTRWGKDVWASGEFSSAGDAQTGTMVLRADTTDATAEALRSNTSAAGTNNQVLLPNNSAYAFHGTIVARQQAADGTACAAWKVEGLIRREGSAGTTVLVNSATTVLDNTPNWTMALSADTTNGGLAITCTGAAATDIRWVATIHTSEVTYA